MKILFIADMHSWHTSLWVKYFSENHSVYLLSDERLLFLIKFIEI